MSSVAVKDGQKQKTKNNNKKKEIEKKEENSKKPENINKNDKKQQITKPKPNLLNQNPLNINPTTNIPLTSSSLIRFETPFLVNSTISNKKLLEELDENNEKSELFLKNIINNYNPDVSMDYSVKDALNKILPPKKIKTGDQIWVRYVSPNPVTVAEVINLQEELNKRLKSEQVSDSGICPIRENLYNECFDEIIRQVTINCLERGILLMRIKTEIEMTITSYQTLYESSLAYGMRTYLLSEEEKKNYTEKIYKVEDECDELTKKIQEMETLLNDKIKKDEIEHHDIVRDHNELMAEYRRKMNYLKEDIKEKFSFKK